MKTSLYSMIVAAACGLLGSAADAAFVVTVYQDGSKVVATGSGTIDTAALTFNAIGGTSALVGPDQGSLYLVNISTNVDSYFGTFTGPATLGSNKGLKVATGASGDNVGINEAFSEILVPVGYVSGSALSASAYWDNQTLASLGLGVGSYTTTWGSGRDADSFTIDVTAAPSAVPELATWAAMTIGFGWLGGFQRRRRRAVVRA